MTKQRRIRLWVVPGTLALLLLAAGNAWTQDVFASNGGDSDSGSSTPPVYQDSFSNNCDKTNNQSLNVDGYNPAICDKVTAASGQECLSNPAETGYALVKRQGNVCYFCIQPPLTPAKYRVIVPGDIATAVYQHAMGNLYCGPTAADGCYWECLGNVPPVIPTAGVTPMPPAEYGVTGGTVPGPQNATGEAPAPGAKGLTRVPARPAADLPISPNVPAFNKAMAKCLTAALPYAVPSIVAPEIQQLAMTTVPKAESTLPFAQLSPISQIFVTETAMALQVQAQHDAKYGPAPYKPEETVAYMTGWFDRCLIRAGLRPQSDDDSPNAPVKLYPEFIGRPLDGSPQGYYFLEGFTTFPIHPPNLMPPPYSTSGFLPRLNESSGTLPFMPAEPSPPTTTGR
jgi:hypothetical protein